MSIHTANDLRLYSETTITELITANWEMDTEIKKLRERIALLEAVAEAAEKFYSDVTLSYPVQDHPLEDALGAAGYLQEEPK